MQRIHRFLAGAPAAAALVLVVSGCATGMGNVAVAVAPYVAQSSASPGAKGPVRVDAAKDARREATGAMVGERTGLGGMAMGSISTEPAPAVLVTNVIRRELAAMGFDAAGAGGAPAVAAQLVRFQIVTPATALYWDINGTIEVDLTAARQGGQPYATRYAVQCTARTYSWPGDGVIGGAITSCLKELGAKVKADAALAEALSTR